MNETRRAFLLKSDRHLTTLAHHISDCSPALFICGLNRYLSHLIAGQGPTFTINCIYFGGPIHARHPWSLDQSLPSPHLPLLEASHITQRTLLIVPDAHFPALGWNAFTRPSYISALHHDQPFPSLMAWSHGNRFSCVVCCSPRL